MSQRRCGHAAVTTYNGDVVVMGGYGGGDNYLAAAEYFDAGREIWVPLPDLIVPVTGVAASLGPCGGVYVVGGSLDGARSINLLQFLDMVSTRIYLTIR